MYSAVAIILLFGLSCYVILVTTGGKARIRELKELRALEHERNLALMTTGGQPTHPAALPVTETPSGPVAAVSETPEETAVVGELRADASSWIDMTHAQSRPESIRTHASPNHRAVRTAPGQALFRRFSRD
jgi:hypothetical protein